jgi:glucose-6-phosphate 1-dehydrogenase
MSSLEAINPFREDLGTRTRPEPCCVVIFGASGDLTGRKLIPALYNIAADGDLPPTLKVVGFARREKTHESFRAELEAMNRKVSRQGHNDELWATFSQNIFYHCKRIRGRRRIYQARAIARRAGCEGRRRKPVVLPEHGAGVFSCRAAAACGGGTEQAEARKWSRVVIEKPFGTDLGRRRL